MRNHNMSRLDWNEMQRVTSRELFQGAGRLIFNLWTEPGDFSPLPELMMSLAKK